MNRSLGTSGICALTKGGCDPRTDGRAQDGMAAPAGWGPQRRGAGWPVLCQRPGSLPTRKVTAAKIVACWSERTGPACAGRHVLLIEDRSEVKFPTTAQRRRGLGPVKKGNTFGVLVHAMIAVDAASGSCLGLVGGAVWSRDGVNPVPHAERPLAERESAHWVDTAEQARAMADRPLVGGGRLFAVAAGFPPAGQRTITSQGLRLEDSQMATAERLVKLAACATKAACIDLQLTQGRDGAAAMPATNVLTAPEIDTLAALNPTLEGSTERRQNRRDPSPSAAAWSSSTLSIAAGRPRRNRNKT